MSNIEEVLADVKQEGLEPFADMEETPSESLSEKETAPEEEVVQQENVPFHKHPRWIERENELQELRESNEATARELEELKAMRAVSSDSDIPDWFVELYGENETAWRKYNEHEQQRTQEIENRILTRQQQEAQQKAQETERWNKWVDDEIKRLEDEGHTFDRNKLIKTMLDYSPTDGDNNLDFNKGMSIYEALEGKQDNKKSEARKAIADTATATSTKGEPTKKDYMTPAELRNRSWGSL